MARGILLVGAVVWLLAGTVCLGVAAFATPQLEAALPPLVIDTDALRGAIVALGGGLLAVGLVHVVVLIGVGARRRWGSTSAILLSSLLTATLIGIFVVPVLFVAIERLKRRKQQIPVPQRAEVVAAEGVAD